MLNTIEIVVGVLGGQEMFLAAVGWLVKTLVPNGFSKTLPSSRVNSKGEPMLRSSN
jgi:hypothetical protein